ncbi:MAG: hypothetical protein OEZ39_03260 [Gammaproteobacteria bacterium]|nr:hypothetical protein [Gammaproteobacteria bacterium]MDH5650874.1 hypothetical protein [Gammaproteobacteria bacterium]
MQKNILILALFSLIFLSLPVRADQVKIVNVELEKSINTWTAHVTLKHGDTGWNHYADGWRVVDSKGKVLGNRTLYHPHVNEQPFTRSLSGIAIPAETRIVFIEAHDKVHGWNKDRVKINLNRSSGERYTIKK